MLALTVVIAGSVWFKQRFLEIAPGKGTPVGLSVRTDRYIATLVQSLEPYPPSLHRDPGQDRDAVRLDLLPLDGSAAHQSPLRDGLTASATRFARILGSDGHRLWFDMAGMGGVNLDTLKRLSGDAVRQAAPADSGPARGGAAWFASGPQRQLAAGRFVGPDTWLGLHADVHQALRHPSSDERNPGQQHQSTSRPRRHPAAGPGLPPAPRADHGQRCQHHGDLLGKGLGAPTPAGFRSR